MLPPGAHSLRAGAFFVTDIDTNLRVDGRLGAAPGEWDLGTDIDLSHVLKMETRARLLRAEVAIRLRQRHRLDFAWFNLRVDGRTNLQVPVDFGDSDFASGLAVDSYMKTNIYRVAYTYFLKQEVRWQLGVSLGVHVMQAEAGIRAASIPLAVQEAVTAPLPVAGLSFDYAVTSRLQFRAHGEYLDVKYGDYTGELIDVTGALEWSVTPKWSVGGGVEYFDVDFTATKDRVRLDARHRWLGYQFYTALRF